MPLERDRMNDPTELLDELCAILECPRDAEALLEATRKANADTKRIDWLQTQKREHHAHWGDHGWVNPVAYWKIGREVKDGTYDYPSELSDMHLREAIDAAFNDA